MGTAFYHEIEWSHRFYLSFFLFFSYWTPLVHRINILPCLSWCIKHFILLTLHHYGKLSISKRVYRDAFHLRFDICELNTQRHITTRQEITTIVTPAVMITAVVMASLAWPCARRPAWRGLICTHHRDSRDEMWADYRAARRGGRRSVPSLRATAHSFRNGRNNPCVQQDIHLPLHIRPAWASLDCVLRVQI